MTRRTPLLAIALLFSSLPVWAEDIGFVRYYDKNEFALTSPGAMKFGLYGYDNPAGLHYLQQGDFVFNWTSDDFLYDDQRWQATLAAPGASLTFGRDNRGPGQVRDYTLAFGGGTDDAAAGLAIGWYRGDTDTQDLRTHFTLGTITRPSRTTSVGLTGTLATDTQYYEGTLDVAYRPLGTPLVTLFGDYATGNDQGWTGGDWSAGVASEVAPGIRLAGRYFEDGAVTAGVQISFGHAGVSAQSVQPTDNGDSYQTYSVRTGAWDRNIFDSWMGPDDRFMELSLNEPMAYQTFGPFDRRRSLLNTLRYIDEARNDDTIGGIVVNTTQMNMPASMAWEIKAALDDFRDAGKTVVLYIENGGMVELLMSSAADTVVMDPAGTMTLPGFVSGTTYLADLLAHWGIGVNEFRNLEYKTSFESLTRTEMSEADRTQRQAMIDDFHTLWQSSLSEGRQLSQGDFDDLIDRGLYLSPDDLVEAGVVDRLARANQLDEVLANTTGGPKVRTTPAGLTVFRTPDDDRWGPSHRIAVVYATGMTDTDGGMRARQVADILRNARRDSSIRAVVLRVDSPGGSILAADMVAQQVRRTQNVKPVVVSMGSLAASGGYWVSMYGGTVTASANTITGSIGVTGARFWDDGFSERLNLSSDSVSRGDSADAGFGITLPLVGLTLPGRDLTDREFEGMMSRIDSLYDNFVEDAADARDMSEDNMRALAAGRLYSGQQAVDNGLIDELANLTQAIDLAREQAGIAEDDKVQILESAPVSMSTLLDLLTLVGVRDNPEPLLMNPEDYHQAYLELLIDQRNQPMVLLPYEYFSDTLGQ